MRDIDADRAGCNLRTVQSAKGTAGRAVIEIERQPGPQHQHETGEGVPELGVGKIDADGLQRGAKAEFRHRHAVRPAGQLRLVGKHHRDENAEAEAGDREIIALEAQDRPADEESDNSGKGRAEQSGECGMQAEMDRRQCAGIGADAGETGMSQADLAGIADEDDEARHRQAIDEDQRSHPEIVGRWEEDRRDRDDRCEDEERRCLAGEPHDHTRSVDLRPNRPCGMAKSTARMTTKAAASLYCELI